MAQFKFLFTLLFALWLQTMAGLSSGAVEWSQTRERPGDSVLAHVNQENLSCQVQPPGIAAEPATDLCEAMVFGLPPIRPAYPASAGFADLVQLPEEPWLDVPQRPPRPNFS